MRRGYQIQYHDVECRYETKNKRGKIWSLMLLIAVLILSLTMKNIVAEHFNYLQNSRTWNALECFSDDMQSGESFFTALDSFCQKVIKGE